MGKYAGRNEEGDHKIKPDDHKAIALLKDEHHAFRKLFDQAEDQDGKALTATARELCLRLAVHMTIEEEILYPALKGLGSEEKDEVNEGIVEHASGKALCAEIEQLDGTEELFKSKVHVLGEETVHMPTARSTSTRSATSFVLGRRNCTSRSSRPANWVKRTRRRSRKSRASDGAACFFLLRHPGLDPGSIDAAPVAQARCRTSSAPPGDRSCAYGS
jgi:hypothetical protein